MQRRSFLLGLFSVALLVPMRALAALWNKAAFTAVALEEAIRSLSIHNEIPSTDIQIVAPEQAENGAIVQVEVTSHIAQTETITLLVEKNPTPLIANFVFKPGTKAFVITRIKMAETSDIKVIVKAGQKFFTQSKNVIVLENGCG